MTMLVVTHEMDFARNVSNKVRFMADGSVVESGPSKAFFEKSAGRPEPGVLFGRFSKRGSKPMDGKEHFKSAGNDGGLRGPRPRAREMISLTLVSGYCLVPLCIWPAAENRQPGCKASGEKPR